VHFTKISPEFDCHGQTGQKTKKYSILFGSRPLGCRSHAAVFRERSLGARLWWWENQCMLSGLTSLLYFWRYFSLGWVKIFYEVLARLSVWSQVQMICIWSS